VLLGKAGRGRLHEAPIRLDPNNDVGPHRRQSPLHVPSVKLPKTLILLPDPNSWLTLVIHVVQVGLVHG
jgi:hypothetical protein